MTIKEMQGVIDQLKAEGHDEQVILGAFYRMFQEDELTLDELDGIVNLMGYHLTDEFKNMSPEDQKVKGVRKVDDAENTEDVEDAKEFGADKNKSGEDDKSEEDDEDDSDEKEEDESDEEAKAMKLFGQK